jgi:hypothetical protein
MLGIPLILCISRQKVSKNGPVKIAVMASVMVFV